MIRPEEPRRSSEFCVISSFRSDHEKGSSHSLCHNNDRSALESFSRSQVRFHHSTRELAQHQATGHTPKRSPYPHLVSERKLMQPQTNRNCIGIAITVPTFCWPVCRNNGFPCQHLGSEFTNSLRSGALSLKNTRMTDRNSSLGGLARREPQV